MCATDPAKTSEAEAAYRRAMSVARDQQVPVIEFRVAVDLARLTGNTADAKAIWRSSRTWPPNRT